MMKGQKGITLVALIITIIVMLILVGVTISVAMNGGLFSKADQAKRDTQAAKVAEAAALAKAEILSDFYTATNDEDREKPAAENAEEGKVDVKSLIESYLGDETIEISVKDTATGYEVETNLDFDETITIDLTGIDFAE